MDQPAHTSVRSLVFALLGYSVTLGLVVVVVPFIPETGWRTLLALLPVVPVLFGLGVFVRGLGHMDELQQQIQLQAIGFAAGTLALLSLSYGFLQLLAGFPSLSWIWVLPLLAALWGIGLVLARRRYV